MNTAVRRGLGLVLLLVCGAFLSPAFAQVSLLTARGDNNRGNVNTNETLLTPANVNKNGFGRLFSAPIDYMVMAQPLYVPNVNIAGQGTHNVIYVATMADSLYAIDADTGAQLWSASMLNGGTTASGTNLPCGLAPGFYQEGIVGTPVIDPNPNPVTNTSTMYLVAKTALNGTVRHHLHAIDITTGNELPGSPVLIQAQSTSFKNHVTVFNSLHQKNRPGILLQNGTLYLGFGSNFCNDHASGWVLSYDEASLTQKAVFNASPDNGLASIWQAGNGLAADQDGNIYVETAESSVYDVPQGGQTYSNSVVKLTPDTLQVADYFTPYSVAYLNSHDLDLSSTGTVLLPDQTDSPYLHELIASGKEGFVYVLNRDSLGGYSPNDSAVIQEFALVPTRTNDVQFGSPAYWNQKVYFSPDGAPLAAFPLSGGLLGAPVQSVQKYPGSHSPSISANGNANGVVWVLEGQLYAFDALSLNLLYTSTQAPNGRDKLPAYGHFVTQTVANGKVFVGTQTTLEAYGLFHVVTITGGNAQSAAAGTPLPAPVQVQVVNPYNGQPDVGATVNFSDGGKGGSFNPTTGTTDANGFASTVYTVPTKSGVYTITISGTGFSSVSTTATSTAGAAVWIVAYSGTKQTGPAGTNLPNPLVAKAQDSYKNGVPGVTVNFSANKGAVPNPASAVTDANGLARTVLQLPTTVATTNTTASASGVPRSSSFVEYSVAGPGASVTVTGGNNQTASAGTQLPQSLTVVVADQYGNPVSGVSVTFDDGGAGGGFANPNPGLTSSTGTVTQLYTLPATPGTVTINATASGVSNPAVFTETGQ